MSIISDIPGCNALVEWFGHVPRFHDAILLEIGFRGGGEGLMRIHAWNTTGEVDAQGYLVLDKHTVVTLAMEGVEEVNCTDLGMMPGIIFDLEITKPTQSFRIEWGASYGPAGFVTAERVQISLEPGRVGADRRLPNASD